MRGRVTTGVRRRSIGGQRALGRRGPKTPAALDATLVALVDRIDAAPARRAAASCRTIILRLRFDDFTRATRSHTLAERHRRHAADPRRRARRCSRRAMPLIEREGVTLLGLSLDEPRGRATRCSSRSRSTRRRRSKLDAAVDGVRDRFGGAAITRGVLVGRDPGIAMPLLPD